MIIVNITCPFCGNKHSVMVDANGFKKWREGELIQNALPELSATKREQLVSRMCPKCQKDIFGDDDD